MSDTPKLHLSQCRSLTVEQKHKALVDLVAAQPGKSDRELAKQAGVSHPSIAKARRTAEATGKALPVEKRVGADGKSRKRPSRAKRAKAADPPPVSEEVLQQRAAAAERIRGLLGKSPRDDTPPGPARFLEKIPTRFPSGADLVRRRRLGDKTVNKLRGTSLGRAPELDELVELNRGAPDGKHNEVVRALIAAAVAGEKVSALRVALPPASTAEQLDTSEVGRQAALIQKLENELAESKAKIAGLKREVENAKTAAKSPSECKSGFRCSICHENKHALLRPVFICDGCINIREVREAMPPPDDGLGIPEDLDRNKQTGATP